MHGLAARTELAPDKLRHVLPCPPSGEKEGERQVAGKRRKFTSVTDTRSERNSMTSMADKFLRERSDDIIDVKKAIGKFEVGTRAGHAVLHVLLRAASTGLRDASCRWQLALCAWSSAMLWCSHVHVRCYHTMSFLPQHMQCICCCRPAPAHHPGLLCIQARGVHDWVARGGRHASHVLHAHTHTPHLKHCWQDA